MPGRTRSRKRRLTTSDSRQAMLMIAPMFVGFFLFTYIPILWILRYCVFAYYGYGEGTFNGIYNFVRVFTRDKAYWESLANVFILSFGKLVIEIPLALLLAVCLNKALRFSAVFRVTLFMPTVISIAIVGLIFSLMFSAYQGIINETLKNLGLITAPINWFGEKWRALGVIGLASVWHFYPINMMFFLVALQSVPEELYECSQIDGANRRQQFFKITLPLISPIMKTIIMLAIIGSLKVSDLVIALTNGQPSGHTEVVMTYVFKTFFGYINVGGKQDIGYASAMSVVTAFILGIVTLVYLKAFKEKETY